MPFPFCTQTVWKPNGGRLSTLKTSSYWAFEPFRSGIFFVSSVTGMTYNKQTNLLETPIKVYQ